jgi:hypothetical protein
MSALSHARHLQREGDVLAHRHVRVKRVGLEHHRQPRLAGRQIGRILAVDLDRARGDILQPGDQAQQGGLAAARGADEDDELAVARWSGRCRDDVDLAEALADLGQFNLAHLGPHFTAPKVRPRTSCFWLNQPRIRIGSDGHGRSRREFRVEQALRRRKAGDEGRSGAALVVVR